MDCVIIIFVLKLLTVRDPTIPTLEAPFAKHKQA